MQLLSELRREHEEIRAILDCIETALDRIAEEGQTLDFAELAEAMYFMTQFRDIVHHNKEALLLRQLARRRRDLRQLIREVDRDHEAVKSYGVAFLESVEDAAEDAIVPRQTIIDEGRRYVDAQRRHLGILEEDILPVAEKSLGGEDWREIRRHLKRGHDADIEQVTREQFNVLHRNLTGMGAEPFDTDGR